MARVHRQINEDGSAAPLNTENTPGLTTQLQVSTAQVNAPLISTISICCVRTFNLSAFLTAITKLM